MLDFDDRTYRAEVLAPVLSGAALPDYFTRYALDPDEYDRRSIEARLGEIKAFWDREHTRNPRYANAVALLIGEHATAKLVLLDPREREQAAAEARKASAQAKEAQRSNWEQLETRIGEVLVRAKGISPRDRHILEELARGLGLAPAAVAERLDHVPQLAEAVAVEPLADNVRQSIASTLQSYAAAANSPREGLSLFHFLGFVEPEYDPAKLTDAIERRERRNRQLPARHPAKSLADRVVSFARVHLIEFDPARYLATLVLDVQEKLGPRAAALALDDGAIDDVESEQLINAAQQLGLPTAQAHDVVSELALALGVELRLGAVVDYVSCAGCNRPYRVEAAPERCRQCGEALFRSCPKCGQRCAAGDVACMHCAADLMSLISGERALRDAREALAAGLLAQSAASLVLLEEEQVQAGSVRADEEVGSVRADEEVGSVRADEEVGSVRADEEAGSVGADEEARSIRAGLDRVRAELDRALSQARARWQRAERAIAASHYVAAAAELSVLERTASDLPGPQGSLPAECLASAKEHLSKAHEVVQGSDRLDAHTRELALVRALELCGDYREAQQQLARIKPLSVREVRAEIEGNGVLVSWQASESPGELCYRLSREVIRGATASAIVTTTDELRIKDRDVEAGTIVRYGVGVERASALGETVWSEPLLVAGEVEELAVLERDSEVRLSWRRLASGARVEVQRLDEGSAVVRDIPCDRAGAVDRDVENGSRYRYCVRVSYLDEMSRLQRTRGLVVFGAPAAKPQPVADLLLEEEGGRLRLRFTVPVVGTVKVLRCSARPQVTIGVELSADELASLGEAMPSDAGGVYDPSPPSLAWYLPVSTSGDYAVAGKPAIGLGLESITEVRAVDLGSKVKLTWRWPHNVHLATVLWRRDRQPAGVEDEKAARTVITTARYATEGGVEIEADGEQAMFIAVLPSIRVGEELLHPSHVDRRARVVLPRRPQTHIGYAIRRSRLRKRSVAVQITEPVQGPLPELLLVARHGELLPRAATDGDVLARLGGSDAIREQLVDLSGLRRPLILRLFVEDASGNGSDDSYRIQHPDTDELLLR